MSALSDVLVPSFSGRIPRRTYWLAVVVFLFLVNVLPIGFYGLAGDYSFVYTDAFLAAASVYLIACYVLFISALVRRLHDVGRTGLWALLLVIPLVGQIFALVIGCLSSAEGANRYGPNPDGREAPAAADPASAVAALAGLVRMLGKGRLAREEFEAEKARLFGSVLRHS